MFDYMILAMIGPMIVIYPLGLLTLLKAKRVERKEIISRNNVTLYFVLLLSFIPLLFAISAMYVMACVNTINKAAFLGVNLLFCLVLYKIIAKPIMSIMKEIEIISKSKGGVV